MCYRPGRNSIFCILPPHILVAIANNGTKQQRESALRALSMDHSIRTNRLTFSLTGGLKVPHVETGESATPTNTTSRWSPKTANPVRGHCAKATPRTLLPGSTKRHKGSGSTGPVPASNLCAIFYIE